MATVDVLGLCPLHANVCIYADCQINAWFGLITTRLLPSSLSRGPLLLSDNDLKKRKLTAARFNSLMREAAIDSKQAGERGISAKSIKKVTPVSLSQPDRLGGYLTHLPLQATTPPPPSPLTKLFVIY